MKVTFAKHCKQILMKWSGLSYFKLETCIQGSMHLQDIGKVIGVRVMLLTGIDHSHITGAPRKAPKLEEDSRKVQLRSHTMVSMKFISRLAQPNITVVPLAIALSELRNKKSTLHEYFSRKLKRIFVFY